MEYIRNTYGVPAKRGRRIRYTGGDEPRLGTITGSRNAYLRVMFDGEEFSDLLHPTCEVEYLVDEPEQKLPEVVPARHGNRGPRGSYTKTAGEREAKVDYMVRLGLGLVMMQEQELDADGRRTQSRENPNWAKVERFLAHG